LHFQQEQPSMEPLCDNDTLLLPDQINFTLVTQVSEDRLWMLTQHCHRWQGRISAAVLTDFPACRIQEILLRENGVYGKCSLNQVTHLETLKRRDSTPSPRSSSIIQHNYTTPSRDGVMARKERCYSIVLLIDE